MDKMLCKSFLLFMFFLILTGCSSGIMDELARPNEDPSFEKPVVKSFDVKDTVLVSWDYDECADEYILERSFDMAIPSYSVVYRGEGTFYHDSGLIDGTCFLYRLIKIRGNKVYSPSIPVYGVSSSLTNDEFEDNNTKGKATLLLSDRQSNIYYYISHDGQQIYDDDWYYVILGPKRQAQIMIDEQEPGFQDATHLSYAVNGIEDVIIDEIEFSIINTEDVTRQIPFVIMPNKAEIMDSIGQTGGAIVSYTIKLMSVIRYE